MLIGLSLPRILLNTPFLPADRFGDSVAKQNQRAEQ
jgi:hypothetical protein